MIARDENAKLENDTELGAVREIWNAEGASTLVSGSQNTVVELTVMNAERESLQILVSGRGLTDGFRIGKIDYKRLVW